MNLATMQLPNIVAMAIKSAFKPMVSIFSMMVLFAPTPMPKLSSSTYIVMLSTFDEYRVVRSLRRRYPVTMPAAIMAKILNMAVN